MVLKPLEFSESLTDSPWFRQNLHSHEIALEDASKRMKIIEQQCRKIISYATKLSQAQKTFANTISEFKIETVGSTQTDDERVIANSYKEFANLIRQIEEHREGIIDKAEKLYLDPLQHLVERINKVIRDERSKYHKESNRFYTGLEKHLHLSTVRKNDFREADAQLGFAQRNFCQASLQYVAEIQSVHDRAKFEFVETLSSFLYGWLSFYHVGHLIHEDFQEVYSGINSKVQKAKESFEATQAEAEELKKKMLVAHMKNAVFPSGSSTTTNHSSGTDTPARPLNSNIKQGYVYMQEKSLIPSIGRDVKILSRNWAKYYCIFSKETRIFTMIPVSSSTKSEMKEKLVESSVSFKLKSCVRRASDSIDKRFCFDVIPEEQGTGIRGGPDGVMTLQALSEEDRRQWLDAMDGREPVYSPGAGPPSVSSFDTMLDDSGFDFVRQCLRVIEEHGIREQGIYRNCGVTSKVQKLMQLALDKRKNSTDKLNLGDDTEWEVKTISSAIKTFLRNLPEPLMTFDLHNHFINAAKMGDVAQRVNHIHYYVYKLPEAHKQMLELIIRHLRLVADRSSENLMTVGNLGVCFGPTLLRPKEETMAAIMDIKFCNVVVEVLIANCHQVFDTKPPQQVGIPCPPKPLHNLVAVMPPACSDLNAASLSSLSSKSATVSSSSITDSINNQKSTSTECFVNSPQIVGTGHSPHRQAPQQPVVIACVRQRQPPPPVPRTNKAGGIGQPTAMDRNVFESQSSDDLSTTSSLYMQHHQPSASTSESMYSHPHAHAPTINYNSSVRNYGLDRGGGNGVDNSSDSLNSMGSLDRSLIAASSHQPSSSSSSYARTKMSASYAPCYNPMACENAHSNLAQYNNSSGGQPGEVNSQNKSPSHVPSSSQQQSSYLTRAIPPLYSNLINPSVQFLPSRRVKTLYSCQAGHDTELSFEPGQIITNVYESKEDGWLVGTLNGKTGLIPANYVEHILGP